ncbi:MAG: tetratricopeptide repeat protein, partial [bacterium]|nr:tetratricopeptide repeat protein [bacterium]
MNNISIVILILLILCTGGMVSASNQTSETGKYMEELIYLPRVTLNAEVRELLEAKKWEEAIDKLYDIYNSTMGDPNLRYYLALCHEQLAFSAIKDKRYKNAVKQLNKAAEYVNTQPRLHLGLGFCYFSLAQYPDAEAAYSRVIQLQPKLFHFYAHQMLGEIYYITNNMEEAREHWEKALKIKPDNSHIKKRIAQLEKYNRVSEDFDRESDMMFSISFDGAKKPQLRELVLKILSGVSTRIGQQLDIYPVRQIRVKLLTNRQFFD